MKPNLNVSHHHIRTLHSSNPWTGNNCTRGGFVCEGYANKVPWTKNGPAKAPPALQAKERLSAIPACPGCNRPHIPHCAPHTTEAAYLPDIRSANGQERKPWNSWPEPTPPPPPPVRALYPPEAPPPAPVQYSQPPPSQHERHLSHEHQAPPPPPPPQPLHQQSSRVYHHAPSMSHIPTSSPAPAPAPAPVL